MSGVARGFSGDRPHVRPVLAVWLRDRVYSTTSPRARKGRNLEASPECALAAGAPLDIVIAWVTERELVEELIAYDEKYGWPVTIKEDETFDAPYGAPTAVRPPYRVYEIKPRCAFAFGTSDGLGARSTRFRFAG